MNPASKVPASTGKNAESTHSFKPKLPKHATAPLRVAGPLFNRKCRITFEKLLFAPPLVQFVKC